MIERNEYLDMLKRFKDKELIKVVTGIRRCGKSTLLEMFKDYLLNNGVKENQIISVNLEDLKYNFIDDYMSLYNYINDNLIFNVKNYVFIAKVVYQSNKWVFIVAILSTLILGMIPVLQSLSFKNIDELQKQKNGIGARNANIFLHLKIEKNTNK